MARVKYFPLDAHHVDQLRPVQRQLMALRNGVKPFGPDYLDLTEMLQRLDAIAVRAGASPTTPSSGMASYPPKGGGQPFDP